MPEYVYYLGPTNFVCTVFISRENGASIMTFLIINKNKQLEKFINKKGRSYILTMFSNLLLLIIWMYT